MPYNFYFSAHDNATAWAAAPQVGTAAAGVSEVDLDLSGQSISEDTTYYILQRAESDAGEEEAGTDRVCAFQVSGGALVEAAPNALYQASAEPAPDGALDVAVLYPLDGEAGEAANIQVAELDEAGDPDWASPVLTISVSSVSREGLFQSTQRTGTTWATGRTVRLAARAVTSGGTAGDAYTLDPAVADADAPADVDGLSVSQV